MFYKMSPCGPSELWIRAPPPHPPRDSDSLCGFSSGIWPHHFPGSGESTRRRRQLPEDCCRFRLGLDRRTRRGPPFHLNRCAFISKAFRQKWRQRRGPAGSSMRARFPRGLLQESQQMNFSNLIALSDQICFHSVHTQMFGCSVVLINECGGQRFVPGVTDLSSHREPRKNVTMI